MWLRRCCISSLQRTWACPTHAACTQGMKIPVKHASKCHYFFHIIFPKYIVAFLEMHLHGTLWTIIAVFSVVISLVVNFSNTFSFNIIMQLQMLPIPFCQPFHILRLQRLPTKHPSTMMLLWIVTQTSTICKVWPVTKRRNVWRSNIFNCCVFSH